MATKSDDNLPKTFEIIDDNETDPHKIACA